MSHRNAVHAAKMSAPRAPGVTSILSASILLAACGSAGKPPKSQVVASVNSREITISQLNQALQTLDPPAVTPAIAKNTVDSLIDEELLVQGALKEKLDRDPATMQAIEDTKRQILARAYAERSVWPKVPLSLAEAEKYYRQNPLLFEKRRTYELTVYTISIAAMNDVLREDLEKTHSADEVRAMLEKHDVKFETQQVDAGSESIPAAELPIISKASVGDLITAVGHDDKVLLTSIQTIEDKPLSFERARSAIEDYLTSTKRREAMTAFLKREKAGAKISYSTEFASNQPQPAAASATQSVN